MFTQAPASHNAPVSTQVDYTPDAPPVLYAADGPDGTGPALFIKWPEHAVIVRPPAEGPERPRPAPRLVRVSQGVQMARLIKKVLPIYPPLAKSARVSGAVHLIGIIAKDGTIRNLQLVSGHPLLTSAAMEAVRQWVYQPTLLSGEPVEVIAPIEVNFTLGQ
ncbi:MAG TPA: energy transducer TonB [Bryobacteraceae bacterium]|nr:energy transducer TonB [Bryobacteraceae bacterium]